MSVKTLDPPGLHPFLIVLLEMVESLQDIFEEFQLFCLMKVFIEMGQQPVDQSPVDEVTHLCLLQVFGECQVQLTDL
jgi:hypothetical protein